MNNIHSDNAKVYRKIPKKYNPTVTKDETTQVESFNSIMRLEIARFRRRCKSYSKSIDMIKSELKLFLLFYNKKARKHLEKIKIMSNFVNEMIDRRVKGFDFVN